MDNYTYYSERYLAIIDKMDGGKNYKWHECYEDLIALHKEIYKKWKPSNRPMILCKNMLSNEVYSEAQRIYEFTHR